MNNPLTKSFLLTFLLLAFIISIYPPFFWGEEHLRTDRTRQLFKRQTEQVYQRLPIKERAFLFGDSKERFQFGDKEYIFHRQLATSDLVLEYIVALLLSFLVALIFNHLRKPRSA